MGNPITDYFTGDSPERRQLREAKAGRGGGAGYDTSYLADQGINKLTVGRGEFKKPFNAIFARKGGKPGYMLPGQPDSWKPVAAGREFVQQSSRRHNQIVEGNKAENARAAKGGFLQPKNQELQKPSGRLATVSEYPEHTPEKINTAGAQNLMSDPMPLIVKPTLTEDPPVETPLGDNDSVTPMNSNPSRPPRNAAEFGAFMQTLTGDRYGIKFPGEQERNGYQSIYLPGTRSAGEDESAADNKVMGTAPQQAIDLVNGSSTEIVIGGNMGAQTGTSSAPDKGDQSRVVKGFNGHEFGGEHEAPPTIFRDKRSRALLDYDGDGGMMGAMRAAEAAQNTIKQNGVLYALDGEGKGTALDEDTAREFKKDGNKMASQDFLRNYRYPETPAESQSADSLEPEMPTSDINKDTGTFTSGMESNVIKDPSEAFRALGLNVRR